MYFPACSLTPLARLETLGIEDTADRIVASEIWRPHTAEPCAAANQRWHLSGAVFLKEAIQLRTRRLVARR